MLIPPKCKLIQETSIIDSKTKSDKTEEKLIQRHELLSVVKCYKYPFLEDVRLD